MEEDLTLTVRVGCRPCGMLMKGDGGDESTFACPSCGQQVDLFVDTAPDAEVDPDE